MSDVIGFLEKIGTDVRLHGASMEEIEMELELIQADEGLRQALLFRDVAQVRQLLGRQELFSVQYPGREDEEDDEDEREEDPEHEDEEAGL